MDQLHQNDFIRSLRSEVNQYFKINKIDKKANLNMYIKTIFMMSLYLIPYLLMVFGFANSTTLLILTWLFMGLGMAGIGMCVMHDGNHNSFSNSKHINKMMGFTLQMLGGTYKNWQIQHNKLHHKFTNIINHDPDVKPIKLLRFSPDSPYKKIYRFQFIYAWFLYGLMTFSFSTIKEFKQLVEWKDSGVILINEYRQLMLELIGWKLMYYFFILIIPLYTLDITLMQWFGLFFLMHFVAGFILALIFQTAHIVPDCKHLDLPEKMDVNSWAINQVLTTSNYAPNSGLFSWFIGGLNYQIEHHLFPGVCHVHYASISEIVKRKTQEYGLPYNCQPTFFSAIFEHAKMLYRLGVKPNR